jgi:hypothetical protein
MIKLIKSDGKPWIEQRQDPFTQLLTQMVQLNLRKAEDSLKTEPGVIA